ncbi:MAG: CRISPR-associated protein Cas6 [Cytophagales bacterium]|nr:MAG: CRISPR-associated protein Cas6 [Cytophagales bacterium]
MRVRIIFAVLNRGEYVPFHHQHILSQIIEDILQKGAIRYPHYNFSSLKGLTKVSRKGLRYYSSKVTLVFSTDSEEFAQLFLSKLFERKQIKVGALLLRPESVEAEERPAFANQMKYICISPLVISDKSFGGVNTKKFIPPDSDVFSDLLYETTMQRMEKSGQFSQEQINSFYQFQFLPDKEYLDRIKDGEKKFARIYSLQNRLFKIEVRGYTLPFVLYADPVVQEFVFNTGLGTFTERGFGMIDQTQNERQRGTNPYTLDTSLFPQPQPTPNNEEPTDS